MTRKDEVAYIRAQREIILTLKSRVLVYVWKMRRFNYVKAGGFAGICLGLHVLSNAMLLHSKGMIAISIVFILVGNYIIINSK